MISADRQQLAIARIRRLHPNCQIIVGRDRLPGGAVAVKVIGRHGAQQLLISADGRRELGRWIQRPGVLRQAA